MLLDIDNEVLANISRLLRERKKHDAAGDLRMGRLADNLINEVCRAELVTIVKRIDKANKREQG